MSVEQLRWALAGAKGPDGSYVLPDSVRVKCLSTIIRDGRGKSRHFHNGVGWADGCLGYMPAADLETWMQAAWETHVRLDFAFSNTKLTRLAIKGYSGLESFLEEFARILRLYGVKLTV